MIEDGQKCLCKKKLVDKKIVNVSVRGRNAFFGIQQHKHKFLLVARHSLIMSFKNAFEVGIVNFAIHFCCLPL